MNIQQSEDEHNLPPLLGERAGVREVVTQKFRVGAGTKGDTCEFKRRLLIGLCYLSLGRGLEEA